MKPPINVGLIGCGAIGRTLAQAITQGKAGEVKLLMLCDLDNERLESLHTEIGLDDIIKTNDLTELVDNQNIDLVIEAASKEVVEKIGEDALDKGKNMMIMSTGALADKTLYHQLREKAKTMNVKIFVPSGAICGLDGVMSASVKNISNIKISTTKHPKSLMGAPYLIENNIDLNNIKSPKVIFEGRASEAIRGFPKNVNVAVSLSIAGIGVEKTRVKIIADPEASCTRHEIHVKGDFGELTTVVNNRLHPDNPKTSYLAVLSAIRTLRNITDPIQVGT